MILGALSIYPGLRLTHRVRFIHSDHFYNAPSSPLLLRSAPDYTARILYRSFTPKRTGNCRYKGLAQGPYVAARAGVKPTTLWLKVIDSTNATPRPRLWKSNGILHGFLVGSY